jgi:hypothetical protein
LQLVQEMFLAVVLVLGRKVVAWFRNAADYEDAISRDFVAQ